jgi:murein DD-endopeptidase MepM/ murein hydrolase activator NlpD
MALDSLKPAFPFEKQYAGGRSSLLDELNELDSKEARELGVKKAAKEFESLFIYEMLKAMRKTVPEGGLFKGITGKDTYTAIIDQQLASALAERGGLGLADMIYRKVAPQLEEGQKQDKGFYPPLEGVVSSPFGARVHPILGRPDHHHGVDIAAQMGAEIRATSPGRVIYAGLLPNYGKTVMVEHSGGYVSLYAHNETNIARVNQIVEQGQVIARVGSTGRSTGPHLHFEIRHKGNPIDPGLVMVAGSDDLPGNA